MASSIALPRIMRIGGGAVAEIGEVVSSLGLTRPLVVTDSFLVGTGAAEQMIKTLESAGLSPRLFADTVPDPTTDSLDAGVAAIAEHDCDSVIGFGGGSPMDTAKALGILGRQGGQMRDYKAPRNNVGPALPVIAVPTTAGSGSEATQFTVITDSVSDEKMLCPGLAFLPIAAVIDFELTVSMPPRLTADTGVDALTHAIEAYVSKKANPFSDSLALVAIGTIGRVLRRAYTDGSDAEAREQMMLAATQAGIAFSNSSVALVHGMSRPIGAHFHVAHGLSNAMLFPAVTAFSVRAAESRYADCARALGVATTGDDNTTAANNLVDALRELCRDVAVPTPKAYGIDKARWDELIPLMAEQALASGSPNNNPLVPTDAEIRDLYAQIYG
ncbi:iron-containing alcohol dehydrogenase [Rhodococcus opacus M213]|uniref:Iron-containing alcohol dehydrogenase n=1 Tax=Rhodococcus opacus M213 TaxID=1129896 RepID=K8XKQ4_RHOOP|nr:iron-containing alcohol dehydrogenase [Rhodococcus opacus]EKT77630.1 iron-containing alcohol dehydrogenase [Rhodococcus opacus M213]